MLKELKMINSYNKRVKIFSRSGTYFGIWLRRMEFVRTIARGINRLFVRALSSFFKVRGKKVIHFLHIGKTGGTSIKYALKKVRGGSSNFIFFHNHEFKLMDVPVGDKVFFFIRDPIERFVSAFNSRKRKGEPRYYYPWTEGEKLAFNKFNNASELGESLSSTNIKRRINAKKAMGSIYHIKDSYWFWFKDENYFTERSSDIIFVGRLEHLNVDFEKLKLFLNLPSFAKLPKGKIDAHRKMSRDDNRLSKKAIRNLEKWYEDDYEFIKLLKKWGKME